MGLTRVLYAVSFSLVALIFKFLLGKPTVSFAHPVYMLIPAQILVRGDSRVLGRRDNSQRLIVQHILMVECLFLPCDQEADVLSMVEKKTCPISCTLVVV